MSLPLIATNRAFRLQIHCDPVTPLYNSFQRPGQGAVRFQVNFISVPAKLGDQMFEKPDLQEGFSSRQRHRSGHPTRIHRSNLPQDFRQGAGNP